MTLRPLLLLLALPVMAQTTKPPACPSVPNVERFCPALDKWVDARSDARIAKAAATAQSKPDAKQVTPPVFVVSEPSVQLVGNSGVKFTLKATHLDEPTIENATLSFDQPGSGRIDRLSDAEYERLQKLRQAVVDAETEIAKAHGVSGPTCVPLDVGTLTGSVSGLCASKQADTYEYRGQFLLINVPPDSAKGKP